MDVSAWLRNLGLERYEAAFRDNEINAEALLELTESDLRELEIPLGPRKVLLKAVAVLRAQRGSLNDVHQSDKSVFTGGSPQVERRQLTVMFVDLVGSTTLSERLDPEVLRTVLHSYQGACATVVLDHGGHVAKYLGDGILAYFGWPKASEDAAELAVRAGLEIVEAVASLKTAASNPLAARVGIATGLVVVGDLLGEGAAREEAVIGDVPNVAARLQQLASPGTVVIADSTRRLVGPAFELKGLGAVPLRGFSGSIEVWHVTGEHRASTRFEARLNVGLTALVGRQQEIAQLTAGWQLACMGAGQVVLLCGEPGVGKSRIIAALRERLKHRPHRFVSFQCSPQHSGSTLHPIRVYIEQRAGLRREDNQEAKLKKLEALASESGGEPMEIVPVIASLLGIAINEWHPNRDLSPQQQKERSLEVLVDYFAACDKSCPQLLVFEDLHWADPTSLAFVSRYLERVSTIPVLAVLTTRPSFTPPWPSGAGRATLLVERFDHAQAAELANFVSGKELPAAILEQIVARADGVPLFIEELTRTVIESGLLKAEGEHYSLDAPLPARAIPMTLQDSLMDRLDRLGAAKEIAQVAACLGREFRQDLLAAVASTDPTGLQTALDHLVAADLIQQDATLPDVTYAFRHALVQEAAYQSLLKSTRQKLHARIATIVEKHFADLVSTRPEWLAQHCRTGGMIIKAAELWLEAASRSKASYAQREAASHLRVCLDMLCERSSEDGRLADHRRAALVMLGDILSLEGELEQANDHYQQALRFARETDSRTQIENRLHRPRHAVRNGARIAFYEHGGGSRILLFIAPLAYGLAAFQPIVERLCQEFRIVTVDSRGVGASDPLTRPYPLTEHASDVRAVIEALGGGPVVGVGISRGSNLLFKLAHAEPELFEKLVTIGGFPGTVSPPLFSEEYLTCFKVLFEEGDLAGVIRVHTSFVFPEPATRELQELFITNRLRLPNETMLSFFDPDPSVDVSAILKWITVPVLVTHGRADRMISWKAAEMIAAQLPCSKIYYFEGKGHLPLFTATDEFCAVLRSFVEPPSGD